MSTSRSTPSNFSDKIQDNLEQAAEAAREEARLAEEQKQFAQKMQDHLASFKPEPPGVASTLVQGPKKQISKSGEHFLTMFSSLEGDAPLLYVVKKAGNRERVAFAVINGNSFDALQSAYKLFENRILRIASTKPIS